MDEKLALLRAAVAAKVAYWDALRAIERTYVGDGEVSDKASDALVDVVSTLAADTDSSTSWIDAEHVTLMDRAFKGD